MDVDQWGHQYPGKPPHQPARDESQGAHQRHVDANRQRTVNVDRGRQHCLAQPRIAVEKL